MRKPRVDQSAKTTFPIDVGPLNKCGNIEVSRPRRFHFVSKLLAWYEKRRLASTTFPIGTGHSTFVKTSNPLSLDGLILFLLINDLVPNLRQSTNIIFCIGMCQQKHVASASLKKKLKKCKMQERHLLEIASIKIVFYFICV